MYWRRKTELRVSRDCPRAGSIHFFSGTLRACRKMNNHCRFERNAIPPHRQYQTAHEGLTDIEDEGITTQNNILEYFETSTKLKPPPTAVRTLNLAV